MEEAGGNKVKTKSILIIVVLVLALVAGVVGWQMGQSNSDGNSTGESSQNQSQSSENSAAATVDSGVKNLVEYRVPQGWSEKVCPDAEDSVYLVPPNGSHDCSDNQTAPISVSIDNQNRTDCNQLQNVQNVSKHICQTVFIDDHKTLKAETVYNNDSNYKEETRFAAYYVDTGRGVVKFEYIDRKNSSDDDFQQEFDSLISSVGVNSGHH
jgi:hypothetical protein